MDRKTTRTCSHSALLCALSLAVLWGRVAGAQEAPPPPPSRVTPETGVPDHLKDAAAIILPETQAARAPANSENLTVTVGDITVEGARREFAPLIAQQVNELKGHPVSVAQLYQAAATLETAYSKAGYVLTRATVPPQTLTNGAVFRILIVEGYIESIDLDGVPTRVRSAVRNRVAPLLDVKGLRLGEIERQLVLANDIPGISLKSTIIPGSGIGAAKLVMEGVWQPMSLTLSANNSPSQDYDGASYSAQLSLNALLGVGELIYAQATTAPDFAMSDANPLRRVYALGAIVPIGHAGFTLNPEYIRSDTNPDSPAGVLRVQGRFERLALRSAYPIIRTRRQTLALNLSLEAVSETQTARDFGVDLSEDQLRYMTLGLTWARSVGSLGSLTIDSLLTQGFSGLGARSFDDALASGVPLSRQGSKPDFSKVYLHIRFDQRLTQLLSLSSVVRGQATLSGALPSTAQFSLDSEEAISGFDLGAISVDRGATGRSEMSTSIPISKAGAQGSFTPFIFASLGYGELDNPTVFERRKINAWSVGGGIRFIIAPVPRGVIFVGGLDLATAHSNTRPNNTRLSANLAVRF